MFVPRSVAALSVLGLLLASAAAAERPAVNESARQIPVAYQVDVVVVGGSTGAVSAAVAAAKAGAKVFLAAPHPYLGDDMTATLRLWLEAGRRARPRRWPSGSSPTAERCRRPDPNRIAVHLRGRPAQRADAQGHRRPPSC